MVTLNLSPKDSRFNCQDAREALRKELDGLVKQGVLQWDDCADFSEIKKIHPEHHHARSFPFVGIKHWEDGALRTFKDMIVLGGHAIHSATQHVDFQEVGIAAAAMESARTSMIAAFADRDGGESRVIQFDAPQAYLQASFLQKGCTPTWISIPRSWIPDWVLRKVGSPCFKLHKALYGHPQAGNIWGGKLVQSVANEGLMSIPGHPSTFVLPEGKAFASVDSLRIGTVSHDKRPELDASRGARQVFEILSEEVKLDEPVVITKFLGVHHHITPTPETVRCCFDMSSFLEKSLQRFIQDAGTQKPPKCPNVTVPSGKALDKMLESEGSYKKNALSHLMKVMYGARMAAPHLLLSINRLSSQVTRWTKADDHVLYSRFGL
eukprot:6490962-Amphidinium_carterae.3